MCQDAETILASTDHHRLAATDLVPPCSQLYLHRDSTLAIGVLGVVSLAHPTQFIYPVADSLRSQDLLLFLLYSSSVLLANRHVNLSRVSRHTSALLTRQWAAEQAE